MYFFTYLSLFKDFIIITPPPARGLSVDIISLQCTVKMLIFNLRSNEGASRHVNKNGEIKKKGFNKPSVLVSRLQTTKQNCAAVLGMARKHTQNFGYHGYQTFGYVFWPYQAQQHHFFGGL